MSVIMDKQEHRQRKMVKVRAYLRKKLHATGEALFALGVFSVYLVGICAIDVCIIWPIAHWLHIGTDDGDVVVGSISGLILGWWLFFNVPRFFEWWQEAEPGDEPVPPSIPESNVTASFTGNVVRGVPSSQIWLEVPMVDTDGEDDSFYVRLFSPTTWGDKVIRNHEGETVTISGKVYKPDSEDYDLVLVATMVSVVDPKHPQLLIAGEKVTS